jgi:citrate lyase subunit beta / citryl-CoA lyase
MGPQEGTQGAIDTGTGASRSADLWLRSMLYAPGSSGHLLAKVFDAGADSIILDLEDAVAITAKAEARRLVAEVLERRAGEPGVPIFVRVNAASSGMLEQDIDAIAHRRLTGVKLPKVDGPDEVRWCDALLSSYERARGIPQGSIALLLSIETAAGVEAAPVIARASRRTWCLGFGAEDFALDTGSDATAFATESLYARSRLVVASRAAGIAPPFDSAYPHLDRPRGLAAHARASQRLGFQGKSVIHPRQLAIVHDVYSPSPAQISWAERVVVAFREAEARGVAAFRLDGSLVDYAMLRRAERILALAAHRGDPAPPT